jgi:ribosomal protein S18 acetylase RimI-like enzyme
MVEFVVRPMVESDWSEYRALRIEMIEDTPSAFGETLQTVNLRTEAEWRSRASNRSSDSIRLAAITDAGLWIGSMGAFIDPDDGMSLVGVYVAPRYRGDAPGVTSALLDAVEEWATVRADRIRLDVHESNQRARSAYAKRGFVETGSARPYPLDTTTREIEMIKRLR